MNVQWIYKPEPDEEIVDGLSTSLGFGNFESKILVLRNIDNYQKAREFFKPKMEDIHSPFLMADMQKAVEDAKPEEKVREMEALINSMTPFERKNPDKINPSRKRRIAAGSGKEIQDINRLLKQHKQMAKMMKMISKPEGISKMMKAMQGLTGGAGAGGGGPLFGGGQQGGPKDVNPAQMAKQMGLDPNDLPSTEEMQKQMQELQNQAPKKFKTRF